MTRIFETPRYSKQTLKKLYTIIVFSDYYKATKHEHLRTTSSKDYRKAEHLSHMKDMEEIQMSIEPNYDQECEPFDYNVLTSNRFITMNFKSLYETELGIEDKTLDLDPFDLRIAKETSEEFLHTEEYAFGYMESTFDNYDSTKKRMVANKLAEILALTETRYTDDEAMYNFVLDILTGDIQVGDIDMNRKSMRIAGKVITDSIRANLLDCRVGSIGIDNVLESYVSSYKITGRFRCFKNARGLLERFLIGRPSINVEIAHKKCFNVEADVDYADFEDIREGLITALGDMRVFKVLGFTIITLYDKSFIFDHSSLTQVYQCMSWWSNAGTYIYNNRLTGDKEREVDGYLASFKMIFKWFSQVDRRDYFKITRAMKMAYNIMMNNFHEKSENPELGGKERGEQLLAELKELGLRAPDVYNLMTSLPVSDRSKMDIAYCFHGLPAPDCDVESLFRSFTTKMSNSNHVDQEEWTKFMDYSKTFDLEALLRKYKYDVLEYVIREPGYNLEEREWFQSVIKGKHVFIPDEELGKAYVKGFYKMEKRMDQWPFDAGDVTRVIADEIENTTLSLIQERKIHDTNELLYAFKYAPLLNYVYTPKQVRESFVNQSPISDQIVVAAAKSENTKFGAKVRETFSGDDILRELTSEVDSLARKPITLGNASSLRSDPVTLNLKMNNIAELTRKSPNKNVVIMSLDVSGWSPNANRKYFMEIIRYHAEMTDIPKGYDLEPLWDNIVGVIKKRGVFMKSELRTGMFQGFTGTMDTAFHQKVLFYAIRVCKRDGILRKSESAYGLCLIDDGVIALELDDKRSEQDVKNTCNRFCASIIATYKKLGLIVDSVKTINSDTKYVYLNRFFSGGNEVLTPMKTACKIDRELNRKFSTLRDQISGIMGSGCNALHKGTDPILAWIICLERITEIVLSCNMKVSELSCLRLLMLYHTPATMGGLGVPTMIDWIASDFTDKELRYASWVDSLVKKMNNDHSKATLLTMFNNIMNQELDDNCNIVDMKNVRSIKYKLKHCAERVSRSYITEAVIEYTESAIFKESFELLENREYKKSLHKYISNFKVDASIIEELIMNGPIASLAPLIDKAMKNEIINVMMKPKTKRNISRLIREYDHRSLNDIIRIINRNKEMCNLELFSVDTPYDYISSIRETFYSLNNLTVSNHTVMDPLHSFVRASDYDKSTLTVSFDPTSSAPTDIKNSSWKYTPKSYNNMHDNSCPNSRYCGHRTRGIIDKTSVNYRNMSKISRCLISGISLCGFLSATKNNGKHAYELFCAMWGKKADGIIPLVNRNIMEDVSAKRMGSSYTTKNNLCIIYPNSNNLVKVDSSNLARFMDATRINMNMMSAVNVSRICGLLEYAATRKKPQQFNYNLRPNVRSDYDEELFVPVHDDDIKIREDLRSVLKFKLPHTVKWFDSCMNEVLQDSKNETNVTVETIEVEQGDARVGGLDMLTIPDDSYISGKYIPMLNHKQKKKYDTDYAVVVPNFSITSMYRKLTSKMGDANAYAATLIMSVFRESNKRLTEQMLTLNRRDYGLVYHEAFGDKDPVAILHSCSAISRKINPSDLSVLFEKVNIEMRRAMLGIPLIDKTGRGKDRSFNYKITVMILYLISHGRLLNSDMYTVLCADNKRMRSKTINFAIRRNKLLAEKFRATDKDQHIDRSMRVEIYKICGTFDPEIISLNEANMNLINTVKMYVQTHLKTIENRLESTTIDYGLPNFSKDEQGKKILKAYYDKLVKQINESVISKGEQKIPDAISNVLSDVMFDYSFVLYSVTNPESYKKMKLRINSRMSKESYRIHEPTIVDSDKDDNILDDLLKDYNFKLDFGAPDPSINISDEANLDKKCTALFQSGRIAEAVKFYKEGRIPEGINIDISYIEEADIEDFLSTFTETQKPDDK